MGTTIFILSSFRLIFAFIFIIVMILLGFFFLGFCSIVNFYTLFAFNQIIV